MAGVLLHLLESSFRSTAKRLAHVKLVLEGAASAALLDPGRAPLKCLHGAHILVAPRAEYWISSEGRASARPKQSFFQSASAAEVEFGCGYVALC